MSDTKYELYRPELNEDLLKLANDPIVQNLLYDADLLPEQLISQKDMTVGLFAAYNRLEGILIAFKYLEVNRSTRHDPQRQRLVDALKLAQPILNEDLQSLCESFCPPCAEGELYDYSELKADQREFVTKTEAALDAVDAALKEVAE